MICLTDSPDFQHRLREKKHGPMYQGERPKKAGDIVISGGRVERIGCEVVR